MLYRYFKRSGLVNKSWKHTTSKNSKFKTVCLIFNASKLKYRNTTKWFLSRLELHFSFPFFILFGEITRHRFVKHERATFFEGGQQWETVGWLLYPGVHHCWYRILDERLIGCRWGGNFEIWQGNWRRRRLKINKFEVGINHQIEETLEDRIKFLTFRTADFFPIGLNIACEQKKKGGKENG